MSDSLTIAFVSDAIYPYHKGGKETRLYEISTRLAQAGHDVHIYAMKAWPGPTLTVENGVTLHGICPNVPLYAGERRSITEGILFGLACFTLLTAHFDVVDVDHMPFFPLYAMRIVCWLKGKKMVATWNEVWGKQYWQEYLPGLKGKIAALIESFSTRLPDVFISISPLTSQKLSDQFGISPHKITLVPCGYNAQIISQAQATSRTFEVIFVGRLLRHKHVDVLLEAVKLLKTQGKKIRCEIVGTGPESTTLQALAKKLGLSSQVVFHGRLETHAEVFSLMKAAKLLVLPSTREGFGIVVLEANACGLPVITIDHPDNAAKDLITTENGRVIALKVEIVAAAIAESLAHPMAVRTIQQQAIPYAWDHSLPRLIDTYQAALSYDIEVA